MSFVSTALGSLEGIYKLKDETGRPQWEVFHDLPSPQLTHYYAVMRRPMSLTQVRNALRKMQYRSAQEFVRDVAQIVQNAKAYNDPSTIYWQDADALERYIRQQLVALQSASPDAPELRYPNLEPVLRSEDEMDDDSSDLGGPSSGLLRSRRRRTARTKSAMNGDAHLDSVTPPPQPLVNGGSALKRDHRVDDDDGELEGRRKRGRPPTVDKPHEHRIKAILRAVRRVKDDSGRILSAEFEKVPDAKLVPEYTAKVSRPLALDSVRKNIKRRLYTTVDEFLADMELMFNNAKLFLGDESHPVYQEAVLLQQVMEQTAEEEKKKPDSAYADPDSNSKVARLPMDSVEHRGETYLVGDWVHISNPNDPGKPTVGQIFRLWRENGKLWANCCWYYRPEQTVHKWDKLFWENEVVKSGQYRDHLVDDILEKCFVMFITKYQRGRPQNIGNRSVYLCESRYNENERSFNKIRTWKACIPDEVRNSDYPMDLFHKVQPLRKLYSPLRGELPPDARDDDPIPDPIMGDNMAPPLKGAVYKRPYDPNDPPEEPTLLSPAATGSGIGSSAGGMANGGLGNSGMSGMQMSSAVPSGSLSGNVTPSGPMPTGITTGNLGPPNGMVMLPSPAELSRRGSDMQSPAQGASVPVHAMSGPGGMHSGVTGGGNMGGGSMSGTPNGMPGGVGMGAGGMPGGGAGGMGGGMGGAMGGAMGGGPMMMISNGPVLPAAYILPDNFTNSLDEAALTGVAKLPQGQPLWFPSCPVSVTHRVYADPLPPALRFDIDGETKRGATNAFGFGHSARYLAWKRMKA